MRVAARFGLSLYRGGDVQIGLFDAIGRRVRNVYEGPLGAGGPHSFDLSAEGLASGTYFPRATSGQDDVTRPVLIEL